MSETPPLLPTNAMNQKTTPPPEKKPLFETCFANGLDLSEFKPPMTPVSIPEDPRPSASQQLLKIKELDLQHRVQEAHHEDVLQKAVMNQLASRQLRQLETQIGEHTLGDDGAQCLDAPLSAVLGAMHNADECGGQRESSSNKKKQQQQRVGSNGKIRPPVPALICVKMGSMSKSRYSNSFDPVETTAANHRRKKVGRNEAALRAGFTKSKKSESKKVTAVKANKIRAKY